ncbi:MAG: hypothetical protein V4610_05105 [Pseudomonadota bacterium]|jgi:hypothetical protein
MDDSGYKGGTTRSSKWGCAAAAMLGAPVFMVLTIVDALGDCAPDTRCSKGFWMHVAFPTAALAIVFGLSVSWAINRLGRRRRG